jgi:hypothetical protein
MGWVARRGGVGEEGGRGGCGVAGEGTGGGPEAAQRLAARATSIPLLVTRTRVHWWPHSQAPTLSPSHPEEEGHRGRSPLVQLLLAGRRVKVLGELDALPLRRRGRCTRIKDPG